MVNSRGWYSFGNIAPAFFVGRIRGFSYDVLGKIPLVFRKNPFGGDCFFPYICIENKKQMYHSLKTIRL